MRLVVPISLSVALVLSACTSSSTVDVGSGELPEVLPASSDLVAQEGADLTTTTLPDLPIEPASYLLQAEDLPGWTYVRAMDIDSEPTFETPDCASMTTAWSAHAAPGTRIRASSDNVSFRQTVVEMPDEASAVAIIDSAKVVWEECNPLVSASGGQWWVEPIETLDVEGWQTAGLALGTSDDLIWTITWFQQGSTVIFIDLDSSNPWAVVGQVQRAVAARINGNPDPTLMAVTTTTPATSTTEPGTAPDQTRPAITTPPEPLPLPTTPTTPTTVRRDWEDHAAAAYIVEPEFFGADFYLNYVSIQDPAPADADDYLDGCSAAPIPTMDGLDASYENESERVEIGVIIGIDNEQWAQDTIDSLRDIGSCDASTLGVDSLDYADVETDGDDAVLLDMMIEGTQRLMFVARYDDTMVAIMAWAEEDSDFELPSADTISSWASEIASRG